MTRARATQDSRRKAAAPPLVRRILGTTAVAGGRPYVFVESYDGGFWVNGWSGANWNWSDHAFPPGIQPHDPDAIVGAITVEGERPYLFMTGQDTNLWVHWWSGSAWSWSNQQRPWSGLSAVLFGAITVDGGRPYVFALGGDGNLWVHWWSGSTWTWSIQGEKAAPFGAPMGAVVADEGHPFAFFIGKGGTLWVHWYTGISGWAWMDLGRPPTATIARSVGAITVDGKRPYVFVIGSDGKLWVCWASSIGEQYVGSWKWSDQGCLPPGVTISLPVGATTVDGSRPYVFVVGSDGNLWVNWWTGTTWRWDDQGCPAGVTFNGSGPPITVEGGRPYVFLTGSDGSLWSNWWTGSAWRWDRMN